MSIPVLRGRAGFSLALVLLGLLGLLIGCGGGRRAAYSRTWVVGQAPPVFDPQGPPDVVRWAIERLVARGLTEQDSSGRVVPAAAESVGVSSDGLTYTFRLRTGLAFGDGTPARAADFRSALEAGLERADHGTAVWLLGALVGVDKIRAGKPLPPLGLATPDDRTLVVRLAYPDSLLLRKLALPGVGVPWRRGAANGWGEGLGDYRVADVSPSRMTLLRRPAAAGPDTLHVRFAPGAPRARALLREGAADLLWPLPPSFLDQALPPDYRLGARDARPPRRLLLVLRADLPPTSRAAARHAFAHGLNRADIVAALGRRARDRDEWLAGAGPFDFPRRDAGEVQGWLERGKLGRSVHLVMAYAKDGVGAEVAREMQNEWARLGLDVELRPLARRDLVAESLRRGGAQLLLVEDQPLLDDLSAQLAALVVPLRGPAVGTWRSGWTTREFDAWAGPLARPADPAQLRRRLEEEHIVLPLAGLPWLWIEREPGGSARVDPRFGPDPRASAP